MFQWEKLLQEATSFAEVSSNLSLYRDQFAALQSFELSWCICIASVKGCFRLFCVVCNEDELELENMPTRDFWWERKSLILYIGRRAGLRISHYLTLSCDRATYKMSRQLGGYTCLGLKMYEARQYLSVQPNPCVEAFGSQDCSGNTALRVTKNCVL